MDIEKQMLFKTPNVHEFKIPDVHDERKINS